MRALLAVSQGSAREPRVVTLRWSGGAPDAPPVALVGKGVCFDSGGLSLKPASGMEEMKWDMGGAAAVFGAMKALAGRKAKANVVGDARADREHAIGHRAAPGRRGDRRWPGVTIEVVNTDAEGRLVLADVLHYAKERFKPKAMIDLATLTGAIIVALGHEQAGLFTPGRRARRGASRPPAPRSASGSGGCRSATTTPSTSSPTSPTSRTSAARARRGRPRARCSCSGSSATCRGRTSTSPGPPGRRRTAPLAPKGATGFGIRLLDRLIADHYEG